VSKGFTSISVIAVLAALGVLCVATLTFSSCGTNNGSVVTNPPPPVPGDIPAPPSPGPQPGFPPLVSVPSAPSPGPVPYTPPVVSDDPARAPTFTQIKQSILQTSCISCHSSQGPTSSNAASSGGGGGPNSDTVHTPAGNLDLTTYAGVLTKVVAGDPEKSTLYQYVRGAQMPPEAQLPEDQILAIQYWIAAGAKNN
jgi:mono/diheme cytochrome c family protein